MIDTLAQIEIAALQGRLDRLDGSLSDRVRRARRELQREIQQLAAAAGLDASAKAAAALAGAVPLSRRVIAGTGLTGGGALSADVTLSMPATGPGAGAVGGGGQVVESITLDAQGRVTAATAATPAAPPSIAIVASLTGFGVSPVFVTTATGLSTGSTSSASALRVFAPAASTWQLKSAISSVVTSPQSITAYIYSVTTAAGTPSSTAANSVYVNGDGANASKTTSVYTVGASAVWIAVGVLCTFSYGGNVYLQLERVS